jgi:transcriptional regulator with XRE-family HTH domain
VADQGSPTIRRRELGHLLREHRHRAGLSIESVAERMYCSAAKISRLEQAKRSISVRDVRDLCAIYGVPLRERDRLMALAKESRERSWWQRYDLPYDTYVGLEAAATSIGDFESAAIPGLLQTREYALALCRGMLLTEPPDVIDQRVEGRMKRQDLLTREAPPPPDLQVIMDETALLRPVGGDEVMRDQMAALVDRARLANVTIHVIPLSAGPHPGLSSNFSILGFEDLSLSDVVYLEGLGGNIYLDRPADLDRFRTTFAELKSVALSPEDSLERVQELAGEYAR